MTGICRTGKTAWPDQQAAETALAEIRAGSAPAGLGRKVPCRVYRCDFCAEWHLTSRPTVKKGTRHG